MGGFDRSHEYPLPRPESPSDVPPSQPSHLTLERFKSLVHETKQPAKNLGAEDIFDADQAELMENVLRHSRLTVPLDPSWLQEAGLADWSGNIPPTRYMGNTTLKSLMGIVLNQHPDLLHTAAADYVVSEQPAAQGGMSATFFLNRHSMPLETSEHSAAVFSTEGTGLIEPLPSDAVLRCLYVPPRNQLTRELALREIYATAKRDRLLHIQDLRFSGIPALRSVEIIMIMIRRAQVENLASLCRESERQQRPELSLTDMFALMQACAVWLNQLNNMAEKGIQHRDIKPEHLFIDYDEPEQSDIIDWGITGATKTDRRVTPDNVLRGTIMYFSPRTAWGLPDPNRDIHALALSIGEALHVFLKRTILDIAYAIEAAGRNDTFTVPFLSSPEKHQQLKNWSPYPPEREFAYLLYQMIQTDDHPEAIKGDYDEALNRLKPILMQQRLWLEAQKTLSALEKNEELRELRQRLQQEFNEGTTDSMQRILAECRQAGVFPRLRQRDS